MSGFVCVCVCVYAPQHAFVMVGGSVCVFVYLFNLRGGPLLSQLLSPQLWPVCVSVVEGVLRDTRRQGHSPQQTSGRIKGRPQD